MSVQLGDYELFLHSNQAWRSIFMRIHRRRSNDGDYVAGSMDFTRIQSQKRRRHVMKCLVLPSL